MGKRKVTLFVSYARANSSLAAKLLAALRQQTGPSKNYAYSFWADGDIEIGEDWHAEIRRAIKACDLGLLLISPSFLGSDYIERNELRELLATKPVIPVVLQRVSKNHNLKGLQKKQLFGLKGTRIQPYKPYYDCTGPQRLRFAEQLYDGIEDRLRKLFK